MGAGIAASPHCAERRIYRCSIYLVPPPRMSLEPCFSILAHQLRRRFLSNSLLPEKGPSSLLECATRGLAALSSTWPARRPSHSKFCGPSWDDHLSVPLRFLPRRTENRVAQKEDHLFRRLSRLALAQPEGLPIACRRRSVLKSPAASAYRCRLLEEAGTVAPITDKPMCPFSESRQAKIWGRSLWITGILGTTVRTLSQTADPCPSPIVSPGSAQIQAGRRSPSSRQCDLPVARAALAASYRDRRASRAARRSSPGRPSHSGRTGHCRRRGKIAGGHFQTTEFTHFALYFQLLLRHQAPGDYRSA